MQTKRGWIQHSVFIELPSHYYAVFGILSYLCFSYLAFSNPQAPTLKRKSLSWLGWGRSHAISCPTWLSLDIRHSSSCVAFILLMVSSHHYSHWVKSKLPQWRKIHNNIRADNFQAKEIFTGTEEYGALTSELSLLRPEFTSLEIKSLRITMRPQHTGWSWRAPDTWEAEAK